jgi:Mu transposase, C-terminal domain
MAKITDAQVKELRRQLQRELSLQKAALKAGMDRKSAAKYREGLMPRERWKTRNWRTRPDPLATVWPEVQAELERAPGLQAQTLLGWLQDRYPGQYGNELLRTLQRRVKRWRALHGPAKELFFTQVHEPGRLGSSDFTHMNDIGVTIQGQRFDHLLYHFVLTCSNWEHVTVCFSESFASLSEGLQNALWALGGVPRRHRTDRMTLAVHPDGNPEVFTRNYQALMGHYGIVAEATNPASGHENGDCEQAHYRFKTAVEQALLLRGSRDFAGRQEYEAFLATVRERQNAGRKQRFEEEVTHLGQLPGRRLESLVRLPVKVSQGSTIRVQNNIYSVPARLKGEWVEARVGVETIEVWYAEQLQLTVPRLRGQEKHHIDYRHVIDWLVRKPGAFARYVYRAELFPTSRFRQAYDELTRIHSERVASREYLRILQLAARGNESLVDKALAQLLARGEVPSVQAVETLLGSNRDMSVTALVHVPAVDLRSYDELLPSLASTDVSEPFSAETCVDVGTQGEEEAKDEPGTEEDAGGVSAGAASGDDAERVRGGGPASPARRLELPGLSPRTGGAGSDTASSQPHRPAAERVAAAAGEELAEPGPEAFADEGGAATTQPADGRLSGSPGECAGLRHRRFGQDAQPVRGGPGTGAAGTPDLVHDDEPAGARTAQGQTRPEPEGVPQATEPLGGLAHRRPGLRAAEPGGDGSAVHPAGGALRERQRAGDEQPGVFAVGTDFQGSDDDGGGHRPAGASQRDPGSERGQLPGGVGQESQGAAAGQTGQGRLTNSARIGVEAGLALGEGGPVGAAWGAGSAPLASAPFAVAARPLPPLRLAPLRQPPTRKGLPSNWWGFLIVANGES